MSEVAEAGWTEEAAPTAALRALADGDLAWWREERGVATRAWRAALASSRGDATPTGRAAEAMARVRLLQVSGNLGPFVHEAPLRRALDDCPPSERWCLVAAADFELFMPTFTGADPARVPSLFPPEALGWGVARARVAMATGQAALLEDRDPATLDGQGRGFVERRGRRATTPGTWTAGAGLTVVPGQGFGVNARFTHPDLGWRGHRLDLAGGIDTWGGWNLAAAFRGNTRPILGAHTQAGHLAGLAWGESGPTLYHLDLAEVGAGLGAGGHGVYAGVGVEARAARVREEHDSVELALGRPEAWTETGWGGRVGPTGWLSFAGPREHLVLSAEAGAGAWRYLRLDAELRVTRPLAGGTLTTRAATSSVPTPESPFHELPSAGGAKLLRGAPAGRWRDDALVAAQAEYRHPLVGPLYGEVFVDTAAVQGLHWTAGGGVQLRLPPEPLNVTRLELGVGPGTWGLVLAWGEAF